MAYIAPYELPLWAQTDVPSEYHDKPSRWSEGVSPLLQEPSIIEAIFSTLRSKYPHLQDLVTNKGLEIGLPSQERLMRMFEKTGNIPTILPGGQDSTVESSTLGVFDPRTSMILLTLDPKYKDIALHELGHAAIEHSPEWQKTLDKMPLTQGQETLLEMLGYPVGSRQGQYDPEQVKRLDFLYPQWQRVPKEEIMMRSLFPVMGSDTKQLDPEQEYIAKRLSEYLKYGPEAGSFK